MDILWRSEGLLLRVGFLLAPLFGFLEIKFMFPGLCVASAFYLLSHLDSPRGFVLLLFALCLNMYEKYGVCACDCRCLNRPETQKTPGAGATSSPEVPDMGARSSAKAVCTPNYGAISPASTTRVLT